jgi:hypothetical protein
MLNHAAVHNVTLAIYKRIHVYYVTGTDCDNQIGQICIQQRINCRYLKHGQSQCVDG